MQLVVRRSLLCALAAAAAIAPSGCRQSEPAEVEVEVRSVGLDQASGAPVVVLQDKNRKVALPIWIGPAEAQAIAAQIQGIQPPRPMTHDLMKNVLVEAGVEFDRVVIRELRESTYFARIHLHTSTRKMEIDSRPSDAIALAVRFQKPIYVVRALLSSAATMDLRREAGAQTASVRGVTVQALSPELAEHFQLPEGEGVVVSGVQESANGLQRGDVIVAVNGAKVKSIGDFRDKVRALGEADAKLDVRRAGRALEVTLAAESEESGS